MIQKSLLIEKFTELNLDFYETLSDVNEGNVIQLLNFDELCRFIKKHNIDTIFYHYGYVSPEALQISEEVIKELKIDTEMLEILKDRFDEYNREILELNFEKPYFLSIYCIYENCICFIEEYDYWFQEQGIEMPQIAALSFMDTYFDEIIECKEISKEKRVQKRERLRDEILNDEEFHKCTNKQLRHAYANKKFNDNKELQDLFYSRGQGLYDVSILTFVEGIWKEYKEKR